MIGLESVSNNFTQQTGITLRKEWLAKIRTPLQTSNKTKYRFMIGLESVSNNFTQQTGITLRKEWLAKIRTPLQTINSESLPSELFQKWLYTDITESSHPYLPQSILSDTQVLKFNYTLQMKLILDISQPRYQQYLKLQDKVSISHIENENFSETSSSKRMYLLELTDGNTTIFGVEFQPIHCLTPNVLPGAKIIINGMIPIRRGYALLENSNIQVLGGSVEKLIEQNSTIAILSRELDLRPSTTNSTPSITNSEVVNKAVRNSEVVNKVVRNSEVVNKAVRNSEVVNKAVRNSEVVNKAVRNSEVVNKVVRNSEVVNEASRSARNSEVVSETSITNSEVVVNEAIQGMSMSDDAWLDEVIDEAVEQQLVEDNIDLDDIMDGEDLFEDENELIGAQPDVIPTPISLSLLQISQQIETRNECFAYVNCKIYTLLSKLDTTGSFEWQLKASIMDGESTKMDVRISNEILQNIIGFSGREFKELIEPNKLDPAQRKRGKEGFTKCQSTLKTLNCRMFIRFHPSFDLPLVEKLE